MSRLAMLIDTHIMDIQPQPMSSFVHIERLIFFLFNDFLNVTLQQTQVD